jgi:hypothetical protein
LLLPGAAPLTSIIVCVEVLGPIARSKPKSGATGVPGFLPETVIE